MIPGGRDLDAVALSRWSGSAHPFRKSYWCRRIRLLAQTRWFVPIHRLDRGSQWALGRPPDRRALRPELGSANCPGGRAEGWQWSGSSSLDRGVEDQSADLQPHGDYLAVLVAGAQLDRFEFQSHRIFFYVIEEFAQ